MLAGTGVALRALMMPSFMDNLRRQAPTIKEKDIFYLPILPDLNAPLVATSDTRRGSMDLDWQPERTPLEQLH